MNLGTTEIILIVAVLFLLFGASRLPELARAIGKSRKAFREGMREAEEEELQMQRVQRQDEEEDLQVNSLSPSVLSEVDDQALVEELKRRSQQQK